MPIKNYEYTVGIFLDLSKAIDTVNHIILLRKKAYLNVIRGRGEDWLKDYLANG